MRIREVVSDPSSTVEEATAVISKDPSLTAKLLKLVNSTFYARTLRMFIVSLTYVVGLETVERFLPAHVTYLEAHYAAGDFIASGRKVPRTGGIIFSKLASRAALEAVLAEDPFAVNQVACYDIIEFEPSKVLPGYENLR